MSVLTEAKETLLRALEQIEEAEADLDAEPTRADLCVVYSIGCKLEEGGFHEIGGWSSTSGPEWLHAAMLRRAADARDASARTSGDDEE